MEVTTVMNTAKEHLVKIINEAPEDEIDIILDLAKFLKEKREKQLSENLTVVSGSSLGFWDNEIDDAIWNDL